VRLPTIARAQQFRVLERATKPRASATTSLDVRKPGPPGVLPTSPLGGKVFIRLQQLERERGIETDRVADPAATRPLEEMRARTVATGGSADAGADSPYLEAFRLLTQLGAIAPAPAPGPPAGPAVQVAEGWRPIGPFAIPHGQSYGSGAGSRPAVAGRVSSVAVDPADATHILVGAAGGGVWESKDAGATWTPRTDFQASLAIGAIAFDPSRSQTVYAGTGEGDFYGWLGTGLLRSTDGGTTWNVRAQAPFVGAGFYDLVVDPLNGQHMLAATTAGLFESSDGGATWAVRRAQRTWDLSMRPVGGGGPNATQEVYAGCNDGLQVSNDGGTTWTAVALPNAPAVWVRIEVCHAPSSPNVVYVYATGTTGQPNAPWTGYLWRKASGGGNFAAVTFPAAIGVGQAWYDWCAAVAPNDPDTLYLAAIDLFRGQRSGNTWTWMNLSAKTNGDCIHPDQHHITFSPTDPNVVYASCDGGVYRSPNAGVNWHSVNKGLAITEFEYLAAHPQYDAWLIGGTQDNGTERYEGGEVWFHVQDGDGGDCGIDVASPATCFHTFYSMGMERSTTGGAWGSWTWVGPNIPQGYNSLFYPPLEVSGTTVVQAGQSAFISTNSGASWTEVALPANQIASAVAIASATRVYVGTTAGNPYRIDAVAGVWQAPVALTQPRAGYVSDLCSDSNTASRLWVTYSNVTGGHVYRSDNAGTTWTNVSAGLPTIPANAIVIDPTAGDTVYVAADVGVYRSTNAGANWTAFSNGLPNVLATDLVFHQSSRLLRVGTRSRGVWEINVDRATMPDVEVYVRDSTVDTGRRAPSPTGADPFTFGAQTYWWECTDVKVDAPPYQYVNAGDVDFDRFEDDRGVFASGLVHENALRNRTVRVYVQVHNRGPMAATNLAVKVFYASAALGLPNLPAGFWTNFPNNALAPSSPWQPIAPAKLVPSLECGRPSVVSFDWTVPAAQAGHSCLLAIASAQNDSIATAELNVGALVTGQQKCGLKNLVVVDPPAAPAVRTVLLDLWWPLLRGRFSLGVDARGEAIKTVVLGKRLARYAQEAKLKSRKFTLTERSAVATLLREHRAIKKDDFDLERLYVPTVGPWLTVPAGAPTTPDRVIVVLPAQKPKPGRFALVQWDEQGAPVGGFTFEVVGEGATPKRPQARTRARTGSTARVSAGTRSGSRKPRSGRLANRRPDRAASKPRSRPKKSTARGRRA